MNRHQHITELNYARDHRTGAPAGVPVLYLDDGSEVELPTTWAVCPVCNGEGKHVNPSIDCNGLGWEDFDADPDFAEDYFSGNYDVTCNECRGRTTVLVPDLDAMTDDQRRQWERQQEEEAASRAEYLAEVRLGA